MSWMESRKLYGSMSLPVLTNMVSRKLDLHSCILCLSNVGVWKQPGQCLESLAMVTTYLSVKTFYFHREFIVVAKDFRVADLIHRFEVPQECSVELSPHGYQFFAELFQVFDQVRRFHRALLIIWSLITISYL